MRLGRQLTALEKQRVHRDSSMFNDIYEQKQLVFKYKREVKEIRKEVNKSEQRTARREARKHLQQVRSYDATAETDAHEQLAVLEAAGGSAAVEEDAEVKGEAATVETVPAPTQDIEIQPVNKADLENDDPRLSLRPGLLTKSSTMPNLTVIAAEPEKPPQKLDIVTAEYWVGDPVAIHSVRRPRLQPNEMSDRAQPFGQARKLMVNMPKYPLCSRNCNKPSARLEALMPDASLLPRIRLPAVKRHLTQLSHSLDSLPSMALRLKSVSSQELGLPSKLADVEQPAHDPDADVKEYETEPLPPIREASNVDAALTTTAAADAQTAVENHSAADAQPAVENLSAGGSYVTKEEASRCNSSTGSSTKRLLRRAEMKQSPLHQRATSSSSPSLRMAEHARDLVEANKELSFNAPVEVLARVQTGNLRVTSLTDTTREVTRNMNEAQHRSITSRHDTVVVDNSSQFKRHKVKEVIRYSPTKATRDVRSNEVLI